MRISNAAIFASILFIEGCKLLEEEACARLCARTTARLSDCAPEWPVDWEELGAEDAEGFLESCEQEWLELRSELEPRELEDALEQCELGLTELRKANRSEVVCDDLRAVYLAE
jgi:hypothetical protein